MPVCISSGKNRILVFLLILKTTKNKPYVYLSDHDFLKIQFHQGQQAQRALSPSRHAQKQVNMTRNLEGSFGQFHETMIRMSGNDLFFCGEKEYFQFLHLWKRLSYSKLNHHDKIHCKFPISYHVPKGENMLFIIEIQSTSPMFFS